MVGILPDGRDLAVRFTHELLESFLKQLICGLGGRRGYRCTALLTIAAVVGILAPVLPGILIPTETAALLAALSGLSGFQPLDGQIDLSGRIHSNEHDLDILSFGQVLTDIADIRIGNLRDTYHAGPVLWQCHESTEIGDRFYFALQDGSYG